MGTTNFYKPISYFISIRWIFGINISPINFVSLFKNKNLIINQNFPIFEICDGFLGLFWGPFSFYFFSKSQVFICGHFISLKGSNNRPKPASFPRGSLTLVIAQFIILRSGSERSACQTVRRCYRWQFVLCLLFRINKTLSPFPKPAYAMHGSQLWELHQTTCRYPLVKGICSENNSAFAQNGLTQPLDHIKVQPDHRLPKPSSFLLE